MTAFILGLILRPLVVIAVIAFVALLVWIADKLIPEGKIKRALFLERGSRVERGGIPDQSTELSHD
jgi:hypothetical protein